MATETIGTLDYNEIVFPKLGIDLHVNSTAFSIGGLDIQWYGILITLGLVLALALCMRQKEKYGISEDNLLDGVLWGIPCIIGGVVGARAYYVLLNWSDYAGNWKSIFNIRGGGLAIYGGIIGSLLVGFLVAKIRKVKFLPLLDIVGIGFLLGQGIGRWGNFFNQELFGMSGGRIQEWITDQYPSTTYFANFGTTLDASQPVHPCFLYESLWCLLGFVLLAIFAKKIRRYDGQIFLIYICWYGAERAVVESLRTDSLVIGNVRVSQILAITCVVISIILQIAIGTKVKRMGVDYRMYKDTNESKQMLAEYEAAKFVKEPEDDTNEDTASTDEVAETDTTDSSESDETPAETDTNQTEKE